MIHARRVFLAAALMPACRGDAGPSRSPATAAATDAALSVTDRREMADTLARLVDEAYDLTRPGVVDRLMSIYAESGTIVSATDGQITTSRDSLRAGIAGFWETIGRNMRNPRWVWTERHVEILSPTAAVMTGTYSIPHHAPSGETHVVAGAWTAVFARGPDGWRIVHEHLSSNPAQAMAAANSEASRAPPPP